MQRLHLNRASAVKAEACKHTGMRQSGIASAAHISECETVGLCIISSQSRASKMLTPGPPAVHKPCRTHSKWDLHYSPILVPARMQTSETSAQAQHIQRCQHMYHEDAACACVLQREQRRRLA